MYALMRIQSSHSDMSVSLCALFGERDLAYRMAKKMRNEFSRTMRKQELGFDYKCADQNDWMAWLDIVHSDDTVSTTWCVIDLDRPNTFMSRWLG